MRHKENENAPMSYRVQNDQVRLLYHHGGTPPPRAPSPERIKRETTQPPHSGPANARSLRKSRKPKQCQAATLVTASVALLPFLVSPLPPRHLFSQHVLLFTVCFGHRYFSRDPKTGFSSEDSVFFLFLLFFFLVSYPEFETEVWNRELCVKTCC